jgi:response regulator RpfG family c-di-GMP phosphodiesterase
VEPIRPARDRVLFVDDEQAVLDLYRSIFSTAGEPDRIEAKMREIERRLLGEDAVPPAPTTVDAEFRRQSEAAVEAVRTAARAKMPFAVVFLDVRMPPGPDGVWAAERIREIDRDVEIVVVTAYSDVDPAAIAERVPPPDKLLYLQKPFHPHEIRQIQRTLCSRWHLGRQRQAEAFRLTAELERIRGARAAERRSRPASPDEPTPAGARIRLDGAGRIAQVGPLLARWLQTSPSALRDADVTAIFEHPADAGAFRVALAVQGALADFPVRLRCGDAPGEFRITLRALEGEAGYDGFVRPTRVEDAVPGADHLAEEVRLVLDGAVQAMLLAAEARDPYAAGHQRRVAAVADALAERIGIDAERRRFLRLAALVHDIGLLAVPGETLGKPGRLSEAEWILVRRHPRVGHDILSRIDFGGPVARIVLEHQERCDGSGYPEGRARDELLPESRILAVADVLEAMCSHRPHRPAPGVDAALRELQAGRGERYDAAAVDACHALFGDLVLRP